jgi:hypothetical protein
MQTLTQIIFRSACSISLLLALPAFALAGGTNPPASADPKADRQVKVWTNEDVEALGPRSEPASNTAQATSAAETAVTANAVPASLPPEQDPRWYAEQLAALESDLASVSNQTAELRHFRKTSTGLPTGLNIEAPCEGITTDNLIDQLELRRQQILEQIDDLADTALVNGMPPGILVEGRGLVSAESPLTPEQQEKALVERYESLLDQLADTRQTIVAMHADVAAQGATLLPANARWGGNMTTNLLENLRGQQSELESEIAATEDQMRSAGLRVQ